MRRIIIKAIASAVGAVLLSASLAAADQLHGDDLDTGTNTTKAQGATGTAYFYLQGTGSDNGGGTNCNATSSAPVTVAVSSNVAWITFTSTPASVQLTQCKVANNLNGAQIGYTVSASAPVGGIGTISGSPSGGKANNDGFNTNNASFTVTVTAGAVNNPPTLGVDNASVAVNEGSTATNSGNWSDTDDTDVVTLSASVGTVIKSGSNAGGTWSWSFGTSDGPDESQIVTISANDGEGGTDSVTFQLTVNNVAPTTTLSSSNAVAVDEDAAGSVVYAFSVTDPGNDTWTTATSCGVGGQKLSETATSVTCRFSDGPATPIVSVTATDSDGAIGNTATQSVAVGNVDPAVSAAFQASSVSCGTDNATLDISFTDPGADTHTAVIEWGDGSQSDLGAVTSPISASHTYASAGAYAATVTVTDDDGGTGSDGDSLTVEYTIVGGGVLPPVNKDGSSIFKYNSTIPVKIKVQDCDGSYPSGLMPTIKLNKYSNSAPNGSINEPVSTSAADTTPYMRWSASDQQYIFNVATKPLDPTSVYEIDIKIGTQQVPTVRFGLRR